MKFKFQQEEKFKENNKTRTNLLIMTNEDLKNMKKNSHTKINSVGIDEFYKGFDSHIVELKEETFFSNVNNHHKGEVKLYKDLSNNRCTMKQLCQVNFNNHLRKFNSGYGRKRTSLSYKKIQFFNQHVLNNEIGEADEYEGLKWNVGTTPINEENESLNARQSLRKMSVQKKKERLQEEIEEKKERKFEKGKKGFNFLQNLVFNLKKDKNEVYKSKLRYSQTAKSCDKKEIKMLTELMQNLQENLSKNKFMDDNDNGKIRKSLRRWSSHDNLAILANIKRNNSSINEISPSRKSSIHSKSSINTNQFSSNNINHEHYQKSSNDFRISIHPCSIKISASPSPAHNLEYEKEIDIPPFYLNTNSNHSFGTVYTPLSIRDFNISLQNCRFSLDDLELNSRKISNVTPRSTEE